LRHPPLEHDAAGAAHRHEVAVRRWLSSVAAGELTAVSVASDEVGEIIEQHGVRIGAAARAVNVQVLTPFRHRYPSSLRFAIA
jgi:hypothetical protein